MHLRNRFEGRPGDLDALDEKVVGDGRPVPAHLKAEILREIDRLRVGVAPNQRSRSTARCTRASKTLWICRCAWTTLPRRPQLHRANISKHCLMKQKREPRLRQRTSEATGARSQAMLDVPG